MSRHKYFTEGTFGHRILVQCADHAHRLDSEMHGEILTGRSCTTSPLQNAEESTHLVILN